MALVLLHAKACTLILEWYARVSGMYRDYGITFRNEVVCISNVRMS